LIRNAGSEKNECSAVCSKKNKSGGIIKAFEDLFGQTRPVFKQERVFQNARSLALSSVLALGGHTVTGMFAASRREFEDWSSAYRIFTRSRYFNRFVRAPPTSDFK
jgi:hypothetical protein